MARDVLAMLRRKQHVLRVLLAGRGQVPAVPKDIKMLLSLQSEHVGGLIFELRDRAAAEKQLAALEKKLAAGPMQYELFQQ